MNASRRRLHTCVLLLLALSAACAACTDRTSDDRMARDQARFGGTVVIANNDDLDNLNGLVAAQKYSQEVNQYLLFLPLLGLGPDLGYEPALAESWQVLGDTGVVFTLRRDAHWHDGVQTTARDVVFTYERVKEPATTYPNTDFFEHWTAVEAIDSFTVRVSFAAHAEPLAGVPFLPIMPAHLLDTIPAAQMRQAAFNKRPVGNGPFRFVSYRASDRWVFEANPDFAPSLGGRPYLDRIIWRVIPDATAQVAELTAGTADMILTPPPHEHARLIGQPGMRGIVRPSRQFAMVIWNGKVGALADARVRHGLTLGIDREQIVQTLRAGYGEVAVGPITPYHWAFDRRLEPLPFSPESARATLRAAGLVDRNGDGLLDLPDGSTFQIELKHAAGSPINRDMAEMIRSNLAAIGVRVVTRATDGATMQQDVLSPQRNFQGVILGWNSGIRPNLRNIFHSAERERMFGFASYSNPRADTLIDRIDMARNRDEAEPLYAELQRILRDEQPWAFLYYYSDLVVVRDRLQNVQMDIRGALVNARDWWITGAGAEGPDATDAPDAEDAPQRNDSAARSRARAAAPAR
jgi:peptide/nickel transport system substrate-binding protein